MNRKQMYEDLALEVLLFGADVPAIDAMSQRIAKLQSGLLRPDLSPRPSPVDVKDDLARPRPVL